MKKLNLFLIEGILLFLIVIPNVVAISLNDMIARGQGILSSIPYYEQVLTFVALLVLFLSIFRVGATKMAAQLNWGDNSSNATTALSVVMALVATISSFLFLNSQGVYITNPLLGKIFLMLGIGFVIYHAIHVFRTEGEMGELGRFLLAIGILGAYHAIKWMFFSDFPDNLGENLAMIIEIIYLVAAGYILLAILLFIFRTARDGELGGSRDGGGRDGGGRDGRGGRDRPDDGRRRPDDDGRRRPDDGEERPPAPEVPPDFTTQLDEIERLLAGYETEYNSEFVPACNDVLQTHHDFMNSGGYTGATLPPVSDAQWNRVMQSGNRLAAIDQQVNDIFDQIRAAPNFGRIPPDQNTRLINLTAERTRLITQMQTFYLDFLQRYRDADPPAP